MNKARSGVVVKNVKATLGFEGLKPSAHATRVYSNYLQGKITKQEARDEILRKYSIQK